MEAVKQPWGSGVQLVALISRLVFLPSSKSRDTVLVRAESEYSFIVQMQFYRSMCFFFIFVTYSLFGVCDIVFAYHNYKLL